jgi:hypothetical protein
MNPEIELKEACREWRRLAEVEGEAICRRDWQLVFDCQNALRMLQPRLLRCRQAASNDGNQTGVSTPGTEESFRATVSGLIELERRNLELLGTLRQNALLQKQQLEQTQQNLRRVQGSYAAPRTSAWSSLS